MSEYEYAGEYEYASEYEYAEAVVIDPSKQKRGVGVRDPRRSNYMSGAIEIFDGITVTNLDDDLDDESNMFVIKGQRNARNNTMLIFLKLLDPDGYDTLDKDDLADLSFALAYTPDDTTDSYIIADMEPTNSMSIHSLKDYPEGSYQVVALDKEYTQDEYLVSVSISVSE